MKKADFRAFEVFHTYPHSDFHLRKEKRAEKGRSTTNKTKNKRNSILYYYAG